MRRLNGNSRGEYGVFTDLVFSGYGLCLQTCCCNFASVGANTDAYVLVYTDRRLVCTDCRLVAFRLHGAQLSCDVCDPKSDSKRPPVRGSHSLLNMNVIGWMSSQYS